MIDPLTLAAANAAGPVEPGEEAQWRARVKQLALELIILDHEIAQKAELLAKIQSDTIKGWAVIRSATITKVELNEAGRGIIFFETYSASKGEKVVEHLHTDFASTPDGAAMIAQARSLVGHMVTLYKYQEEMQSRKGQTVRMCAHIIDLGLPARGSGRGARSEQAPEHVPTHPSPAGAEALGGAPIHENAAKEAVLKAAGGDYELAKAAWKHIKEPAGMVAAALVERAVQYVTSHRKEG